LQGSLEQNVSILPQVSLRSAGFGRDVTCQQARVAQTGTQSQIKKRWLLSLGAESVMLPEDLSRDLLTYIEHLVMFEAALGCMITCDHTAGGLEMLQLCIAACLLS